MDEREQNKDYLGKDNISGKDSISPNFYDKYKKSPKPNQPASSAASLLKSAENNAENNDPFLRKNDPKSAENTPSTFLNSVKGRQNVKTEGNKGFLKKKGPLALIISLVLGGGVLMFSSQTFLPFQIARAAMEKFNVVRTSADLRFNNILRYQSNVNRGFNHNITRRSYFGGTNFKVPNRIQSRLARQGISYDKTTRMLIFTDPSTNRKLNVYASATAPRGAPEGSIPLREALATSPRFDQALNSGTKTVKGNIFGWFDKTSNRIWQRLGINRNSLQNSTSTDTPEQVAAADPSKEINGDLTTEDRAPEPREPWTTDSPRDENGNFTRTTTEIVADGDNVITRTTTQVFDVNNSPVGPPASTESSQPRITRTVASSTEQRLSALQTSAKTAYDQAKRVSGVASAITGGVCALGTAVGIIGVAIVAYNTMQTIQYASGFLEAVSKAQSGKGDSAPVHAYMESMTKSGEIEVATYAGDTTIPRNSDGSVNQSAILTGDDDLIPTTVRTETKHTKSALESAGMTALLNDKPVAATTSVESFNMEKSVGGILTGLGLSVGSFIACAIAKAAAATVEIVLDVLSFIPIFGQGVYSVNKGIGALIGVARGVGLAVGLSFALKIAMPLAANVFGRTITAAAFGEEVGDAFYSGANTYQAKNLQGAGGSVGSKSTVLAHHKETKEILARDAEREAKEKSPFDISSPNTFLGSLVHKSMPILTNLSSFTSGFAEFNNLLSSSITNLNRNTAFAAEMTELELLLNSSETRCPSLASIGAVGDAFCNPFIVSDLSTINANPEEIIVNLANQGLIEVEGREVDIDGEKLFMPSIKTGGEGSNNMVLNDLSKYIIACGTRDSVWGNVDQAIANRLNAVEQGTTVGDSTSLDAALNGALGMVPLFGNSLELSSNLINIGNINWLTGRECVSVDPTTEAELNNKWSETQEINGETVKLQPTSWQKNKIYQRFIEDQRLIEEMTGVPSAVTAFLDDYYEKHPLDTSFEGTLARFMGTTKEVTVATLDYMDYLDHIANYDPTDRFGFEAPEEPTIEDFFHFEQQQSEGLKTLATLPRTRIFEALETSSSAV